MDHQTSTTTGSSRESTSQPHSSERLPSQSPLPLSNLAPEIRINIYRYLIPDPGKSVSIILRREMISGLTKEEKHKLGLPVSDLQEIVWRCRSSYSDSHCDTHSGSDCGSHYDSDCDSDCDNNKDDEERDKDGILAMVSLMQTCRLYHEEVAPTLCPRVFFKFPCKTDFSCFAYRQPQTVIASISALEPTLNDKDATPQLPNMIRSMLRGFSALKELHLDNLDNDSMYGSMFRPYMLKACMAVREMCPHLTKTYQGLYMRQRMVRFSHESSKADCHELEIDVDESYRRWFEAR